MQMSRRSMETAALDSSVTTVASITAGVFRGSFSKQELPEFSQDPMEKARVFNYSNRRTFVAFDESNRCRNRND